MSEVGHTHLGDFDFDGFALGESYDFADAVFWEGFGASMGGEGSVVGEKDVDNS
jgi:hypothetical protein